VMIELTGNVCAENTCEARVDVETVDSSPPVPRNAYPCAGPVTLSVPIEARVVDEVWYEE
jgi:hypothetical protein